MGKAVKLVALLVVAILLVTLLVTILYYNSLVNEKNSKISNLESQSTPELSNTPTANIITALGITESPPSQVSYNGLNGMYSHLWITGSLFNSGLGMAKGVGLQVLAFDKSNKILMNATVPIMPNTMVVSYAQISHSNSGPPTMHSNIFSQQNVTVSLAIFHEGTFPNSTRYEAIPIYTNP